MADHEVESQSSISVSDKLAGQDVISGTDRSSPLATPHGEHEVTGLADTEPPTEGASAEDTLGDHEGNGTTNGTLPITTQSDAKPTVNVMVKEDLSKAAAPSKPEIPMSVKPPVGKSNGGPTTPLVKRVSTSTCRCEEPFNVVLVLVDN
jgi:hypothetical protein